jgi:hypothetical protein
MLRLPYGLNLLYRLGAPLIRAKLLRSAQQRPDFR